MSYSEAGDLPVRTLNQNSSIHKFCDMLAEALNDAGFDMKKTLSQKVDVPWTMILVKELIWKQVQDGAIGIKSTTKLDTAQVSEVYDIINRFTSEKFGVSVEFPSK